MNLLILSRYDPRGASSRLRTFQYIPLLQSLGFKVTYLPLFPSEYLDTIYKSKSWAHGRFRSAIITATAYFNRILTIRRAKQFDVVWVEKELFPYLPASFEGRLKKENVPYVVDYDDAIFHRYDQSRSPIIRALLSNKLNPLISGAHSITAGNKYLAEYARLHGASRIEVIPTTVDINRYHTPTHRNRNRNEFRVGWIGSPSTAAYVDLIRGPIQDLAKERKIRFVTIGAPPLQLDGVPMEQHSWALETEANLIATFDVGVMPLANSSWERGKCGYKLIQYMASGIPAIATPIEVNNEIVTKETGFLPKTMDEWTEAFQTLCASPDLALKQGLAGRKRVEENYIMQVTGPKIAEILSTAAMSVKGKPGK
jgi:glycosyltransferase involved in cell wall biosynthesis